MIFSQHSKPKIAIYITYYKFSSKYQAKEATYEVRIQRAHLDTREVDRARIYFVSEQRVNQLIQAWSNQGFTTTLLDLRNNFKRTEA